MNASSRSGLERLSGPWWCSLSPRLSAPADVRPPPSPSTCARPFDAADGSWLTSWLLLRVVTTAPPSCVFTNPLPGECVWRCAVDCAFAPTGDQPCYLLLQFFDAQVSSASWSFGRGGVVVVVMAWAPWAAPRGLPLRDDEAWARLPQRCSCSRATGRVPSSEY